MGVDGKHDRNVICIKVEYRIEESRRSYHAPPTGAEKKLPYDQTNRLSLSELNNTMSTNYTTTFV